MAKRKYIPLVCLSTLVNFMDRRTSNEEFLIADEAVYAHV
jgi:hypothetical protein